MAERRMQKCVRRFLNRQETSKIGKAGVYWARNKAAAGCDDSAMDRKNFRTIRKNLWKAEAVWVRLSNCCFSQKGGL